MQIRRSVTIGCVIVLALSLSSCDKVRICIERYGPKSTVAGQPFSVQPNGNSAMWFKTANPVKNVVVIFEGVKLETVSVKDLVTAEIPPELFARPGQFDVYLLDEKMNRRTQVVQFNVEPG